MRDELAIAERRLTDEKISVDDYKTLNDLRAHGRGDSQELLRKMKLIEQFCDLESTINYLDMIRRRASRVLESGELSSGPATTVMSNENFVDMGGEDVNTSTLGNRTKIDVHTNLDMKKVLSRPIKIASGTISMSVTNVKTTYDVWDLFTKDPTVRAKLRNFAYLRGNLKVRISISATPFHYGKMLVAYYPYPDRNSALSAANTLWTAASPFVFLNYVSQSPGAQFMDIRANEPLEMEIPFICPKPYVRLWNGSANISDVTSLQDVAEMGRLYFASATPIRAVNGITDPPYFQIYAWMEDVELSSATGTIMQITTESGDEREIGPVERISTALARASGEVAKIPSISGYALASSMMFGSLSKFAAILGWSKPRVLEEPIYVKNNAFQSTTSILCHDTALTLRSDPKGELLIDPKLGGSNRDNLAFDHIAQISSYLSRFDWAVTDVPLTPIYRVGVTPHLATLGVTTGTAKQIVQPTAMMFCAVPFQWWNADIVFTIEIATTAFHRGKLLIGYEPNCEANVAIDAAIKLNKQFQRIIDIQETQKVQFRVKWSAIRMWLSAVDKSDLTKTHGSGLVPDSKTMNGYIYFAPFTELIAPDSTSPVRVMISVHAENLRTSVPVSTFMPTKRIITESGELSDLNKQTIDLSVSPLYNFGEEYSSLRTWLRRYIFDDYDDLPLATATAAYSVITIIAPNLNTAGPTFSTTPVAELQNHINYTRFAFMGFRGSIKYRYAVLPPNTIGAISEHGYTTVQMRAPGTSFSKTASQGGFATASNVYLNVPFLEGACTFDRDSNGAIEFEVPFYSDNFFLFSSADDWVGTNPSELTFNTTFFRNHAIRMNVGELIAKKWAWTRASALGEDGDFLRFQGAPLYVTT